MFIHCNEAPYFGIRIIKSECQNTNYTYFLQTNYISHYIWIALLKTVNRILKYYQREVFESVGVILQISLNCEVHLKLQSK